MNHLSDDRIRLQKYMSECGVASRRKSEELIAKGAVKVNGTVAKIGDSVDPKRDIITLNGKKIENKTVAKYIMLHKPRGFVTTMSDELGRRCVASLVEDVGERVYPIGRLDRNSEGLLLLTNDGEFANAVMHPSKTCCKSLQSYHKTGHIRRADSCYERRNDDRRQNDRSGAGDGARKARRQSGYRNSAFRGQKQADKKNVRGARNRGRTPQENRDSRGQARHASPGQVARADPAGGFAYTFGCRRKVEQKGEKKIKCLNSSRLI